MPKVIIAGAGLVGALHACYFAQRGWQVEVYEYRSDIRQMEHVPGRSINLALSFRGKAALEEVGLKDYIVEQGVPLYSRLVHNQDGETFSRQPYGQKGDHIVSINRRHLNEVMISQAEKSQHVRFFFQHKVKRVDIERKELHVENEGVELIVTGDLIVAADGAYSAVRRSISSRPRFDFSQQYIEHGYVELNILPKNGEFALEPNVFHLWPRGNFTMIALANIDKTFTVTIFAPFSVFEKNMSTPADQLAFFRQYFADAIDLIGEEALLSTFARVRPQALVSIKCYPHHFGEGLVLTGDAAHAMVPFYGQGMNCGFEDCLVLKECLDEANDHVPTAVGLYTKHRTKDAHSINDLAMYNYEELRDLVNHIGYRMRKKLDLFLNKVLPSTWIPLYSMVTFTRIPYSQVIERRQWQDKVLTRTAVSVAVVAVSAAVAAFAHRTGIA